jgi:probable phosphoglycerate mutase
MTTTLYLIRHGETDWNVARRWQGHADMPLNNTGIRQAQLLAQRLQREGVHFDSIYSSDLARAYRTAWEIGSLFRIAVQLWPPLREMDVGTWSGLTRDEIRARFPDDYACLARGEDIPRGGGETAAMLRTRILDTVEAMVAHHPDKTLALVTHGGPIRMLVNYVCETYGSHDAPRHYVDNTSLSVIVCHSYMWELTRFNEIQHLAGLTSDEALVSAHLEETESPEEQSL